MYANLYKKYLMNTPTGSQQKMEVSINGVKGVFKYPQNEQSYDCFVEEFCYLLAQQLNVPHCVQRQCTYRGRYGVFSSYAVKDISRLISMEEFLNTSNPETTYHIFDSFQKREIEEEYARTVLFDILTRQIDRNTGNLSICSTPLKLYPLFDSGLSLFSTFEDKGIDRVIDTNIFRMRYGISRDYLFSIPTQMRKSILTGFRFDMKKILEDCFVPDKVTQFRLDAMEYWIANTLHYMEDNSQ